MTLLEVTLNQGEAFAIRSIFLRKTRSHLWANTRVAITWADYASEVFGRLKLDTALTESDGEIRSRPDRKKARRKSRVTLWRVGRVEGDEAAPIFEGLGVCCVPSGGFFRP